MSAADLPRLFTEFEKAHGIAWQLDTATGMAALDMPDAAEQVAQAWRKSHNARSAFLLALAGTLEELKAKIDEGAKHHGLGEDGARAGGDGQGTARQSG